MTKSSVPGNRSTVNSSACSYIASAFDSFGVVTFLVADDGRVRRAELAMRNDDLWLLQFCQHVYGGKIETGRRFTWRLTGAASEMFAKEIQRFAPRKRDELGLYLKGRRLLTKQRRIFTKEKWRSLPLTSDDKRQRHGVAQQLLRVQHASPQSFSLTDLPSTLVRRSSDDHSSPAEVAVRGSQKLSKRKKPLGKGNQSIDPSKSGKRPNC